MKLYPFMVKGSINISNRNNLEGFDDVVDPGIYMVIPGNDTYGTLCVYQSFNGAGGVVQRYYHPNGINRTRIKVSNSENIWTEI